MVSLVLPYGQRLERCRLPKDTTIHIVWTFVYTVYFGSARTLRLSGSSNQGELPAAATHRFAVYQTTTVLFWILAQQITTFCAVFRLYCQLDWTFNTLITAAAPRTLNGLERTPIPLPRYPSPHPTAIPVRFAVLPCCRTSVLPGTFPTVDSFVRFNVGSDSPPQPGNGRTGDAFVGFCYAVGFTHGRCPVDFIPAIAHRNHYRLRSRHFAACRLPLFPCAPKQTWFPAALPVLPPAVAACIAARVVPACRYHSWFLPTIMILWFLNVLFPLLNRIPPVLIPHGSALPRTALPAVPA